MLCMNICSSPANQEATRIVIADTHRLFAEACGTLLQPEFKVMAIVTHGAELPEVVARVSPELIVADAEMPRIRPFGCWKNLQGKSSQHPKLVILTSRFGTGTAIGEFRKGACAVVSKQCGTQELLRAVRSVELGEYYVSAAITQTSVESLLKQASDCRGHLEITDRQREILRLLAHGMAVKEVAEFLGVCVSTVNFHKYRAMTLLNLRSNADLFRYVIQRDAAG
jgi:DNA-binding NarL/FixJ family response regulator